MMAQKNKPETPGVGRPKAPAPKEDRITIYLTRDEVTAISRLASAEQRSISQWARMQIQKILKRKGGE